MFHWASTSNKFQNNPNATYDYYGSGVALSSNGLILAVGAKGKNGAAGNGQGGVYIYDWNGTAWIQRGEILWAPDAAGADEFGAAVALNDAGTILAVGASMWEGSVTNQGGVYIFDWNGSAWVQRGTVLEDPLPEGSSRFGEAVALNGSGTRLIVGAYLKHNGGTNRGTVRRYDWNGSSWASTAVVSPMSQNYMWFGRDVALSSNGNVLFVGAAGFTSWDHASCGGVYVFDWNGSSYVSRSGGDFPSIYGKSQSQRMGSSVATNGTGSVLLNYSSSYCQTYEWDGAKFVMRRELFVALNNRNTVAVDDAAEKLVIGMITTSDYRGGIWTFAPMSIGGLVSMRGVNNVRTLLANRDVRLYNRSTGQLVQSTTTNDIGSYGFNVSSGSYNVVVLDDEAGTVYNDQIRRAVVS